MQRSRLRLGIAFAVITILGTTGFMAGQTTTDPAPQLTVQGTAEVRTEPDLARVRVGVSEQAASAGRAHAAVSERVRKVLDAIRSAGIPDKDIQTSDLSLNPVYGRSGPGQAARIEGYRASNTVEVRLTDLDKVGDVMDAATGAGANQIHGISFEMQDDLAPRKRALALAVNEAREKASTMAEALGVRLLGILDVREGGVQVIQPQPRMMQRAVMAAEASTPVATGEVSVRASVTVVYRIGN